jgi:hypothetical protein
MRWLKNQPWWDDPTYEDVVEGVEWNLWQRRQPPFNDLDVGDALFLVCGDGKGGSEIWAEGVVTAAVREHFDSMEHAWSIMVQAWPKLMSKKAFVNHRYNIGKAEEGWLLAWSYDTVRPIGVPRSTELKFRPNGWRGLEDIPDWKLKSWGIIPKKV